MSLHCIEIERKFLVADDSWRAAVKHSDRIIQGYICTEPQHCVRVRVSGDLAFITFKGKSADGGIVRPEFEFEIPRDQAEKMLATFCAERMVEKSRHLIDYAGKTWEVDEFFGRHAGLVIAEIELEEVGEQIDLPPWVGTEVTHDHSYANSSLALK